MNTTSDEDVARLLSDIAQALDSADGMSDRIRRILELARRLLVSDRCAVLVKNGLAKAPELFAVPELLAAEHVALESRLTRMLDRDASAAPMIPLEERRHLALPLVGLDQVVGILIVERQGNGAPYRDADLRLLSVVAAQLGAYLKLLGLHQAGRELERFKEEMTSVIVHDLRNPLSVIVANVEYLIPELEQSSAAVLECLADIGSASKRMLRLIANLLDLARLESSQLAPDREAVPLQALLKTLVNERRIAMEARKITVLTAIADVSIVADRDLVTRVIENVLDNASRYTKARGTINIKASATAHHVRVAIGNTGAAIPAEVAAVIFDKFGQAPGAARQNLGLGLYFCRLAIEAHGGRIWVDTEPDFPTVFHIELPLGSGPPKKEKPDPVDEADDESFPASDPPAFNPGHAGAPK